MHRRPSPDPVHSPGEPTSAQPRRGGARGCSEARAGRRDGGTDRAYDGPDAQTDARAVLRDRHHGRERAVRRHDARTLDSRGNTAEPEAPEVVFSLGHTRLGCRHQVARSGEPAWHEVGLSPGQRRTDRLSRDPHWRDQDEGRERRDQRNLGWERIKSRERGDEDGRRKTERNTRRQP